MNRNKMGSAKISSTMLTAILGIVIAGLLIGYIIPVGMNAFYEGQDKAQNGYYSYSYTENYTQNDVTISYNTEFEMDDGMDGDNLSVLITTDKIEVDFWNSTSSAFENINTTSDGVAMNETDEFPVNLSVTSDYSGDYEYMVIQIHETNDTDGDGVPNSYNADIVLTNNFEEVWHEPWDDSVVSIYGILGIFIILVPLIALATYVTKVK